MHKGCIWVVYCPPCVPLLVEAVWNAKKGLPDWVGKNTLNQAVNVTHQAALSDSPPSWEWLQNKLHYYLLFHLLIFNFIFIFWPCFQRRQGNNVFLDVVLGNKHNRDLNNYTRTVCNFPFCTSPLIPSYTAILQHKRLVLE